MYTIEIQKELSGILGKLLKRDGIELSPETKASDVPGWDSLTNMLFINEIEKHYKIRFSFKEIVKISNVGDLCNAILSKLGQ
mgnify:CR=1 FL=1